MMYIQSLLPSNMTRTVCTRLLVVVGQNLERPLVSRKVYRNMKIYCTENGEIVQRRPGNGE